LIHFFTDSRSWSETVSACREAEALRPELWDDLSQRWQNERVYCHPESPAIRELVQAAAHAGRRHCNQVHWLFQWCFDHLRYGRLEAPWFPLVRTDEDVLRLREGTCGDFAHLFVA
jgi:transglutaminase-like putative cysteine protease